MIGWRGVVILGRVARVVIFSRCCIATVVSIFFVCQIHIACIGWNESTGMLKG